MRRIPYFILHTPYSIRSRGFTLVESVIVVGIFSLLLLAIYNLSSGYSSIFNLQQATIETAGSARLTLDTIDRMAREANRVIQSHSFSGTAYTTGTTTLVLELPSVNAAGDVLPETHDYVLFYATGTQAYRLLEAATGSARPSGEKRLSESIVSLLFSFDTGNPADASRVDTTVSTESGALLSQASTTLSERTYLRNK